MSYNIKLPVFEGPFDLLLYLIKKNEVDIYDIPIAKITHQYLEYIELMKMLDLDIAGEFIEMVATLMLIKVRVLLPRSPLDGEEEIEDPRAALVAQLIEYRQFKDVSGTLGEMENHRRKYFPRGIPEPEVKETEEEDLLADVSLFDLLAAFKTALDNIPKVTVHRVNVIKITIEDQVKFIFAQLGDRPYMLFREIVRPLENKIQLIVTFIAMLDLIRLHFLSARQSDVFGEIRLVPLQQLSIESYMELRDQELMPDSVNGENGSE